MRRAGALAAGMAAALAFPPFGVLPGLLGFGLMAALQDTDGPRPLRSAFLSGWLSGLGYFMVSVWWVTEAFMVDAKEQGWMAPFALVLLGGGLALFWGAAGAVYRLIGAGGSWRILTFAASLSGFEWLRGHVFTGFPWNLPGEAWQAGGAPSQGAALVGSYGMTFLTVAMGASASAVRSRGRDRAIPAVLAAVMLAALWGYGSWRLAHAPAPAADAPLVRLVQANIDQKTKWRPENLNTVFDTYVRLTRTPGARRPDVVVWPEGALPAVIDDLLYPDSPYLTALSGTLAPGQTLMLGANRAGAGVDGKTAYFNSLISLRREPDGGPGFGGFRVTGIYDKHRLVPFGEFLPYGAAATRLGFRSLVHMPEDFTAGPPPTPLRPLGLPAVQPLICYEALFPRFAEEAGRRSGVRAAWMLNVSNDAWFGATSGPWQHLNLASYRAIEEGLPIARATPTGVTAMIDAYGRPTAGRLGLGREGVIDAVLPPPLPPTPYVRWGDAAFAVMVALGAGAGLLRRRRPPAAG